LERDFAAAARDSFMVGLRECWAKKIAGFAGPISRE